MNTTIHIFPGKTQWTIRTWANYLWMKLLRKNVRVCSGTDDNKTLQEAADALKDGGSILLEKGEYPCINVFGTAPSARILDGGTQIEAIIRYVDAKIEYELASIEEDEEDLLNL